jgi:polyphosphate kinase 2 (PPK2 family)
MGYCTPEQTEAFLQAAPEFERHLIEDGFLLYKYWLCCDQDRQEERFEARRQNPRRRWKLSPIDLEARTRYQAYTEARERMLAATHTGWAPWTLVDFNDQNVGRLTLLRDLLDRLPDTQLPVPEIDWPDLKHAPLTEQFGVLKPIPTMPVDSAKG